ncbi:hypothetical protein SISNIDRAFT_474567 [Sistotremastrum niveocremeum HHB9708]|uniref:Uncharacterized protein n=1 Tax=Sistotremastrum niveocremeum HHB9708 TaxID=1314777 RepID=A0A164UBV0_9AGAM|nr:hypothetical protein SISNIDRAFT_474567 [Sistotremastrum niveocremeum HHB9708]
MSEANTRESSSFCISSAPILTRSNPPPSKRHSPSSSISSSYGHHTNLWDSDATSSLSRSPLLATKLGPKLIYRTSTDVFLPLSGPSQVLRKMQLLTVHNHGKLGQDRFAAIRGLTLLCKTVGLLNRKQIKQTSVDLARFRWEEQTEDGRGREVTSRITIWIGVLPDTNGDAAFDSAQAIIELLKKYEIDDIDIAFRESEAQLLASPLLYAPVNDVHSLKSSSIAGLRTLHMQGTLGFYFKIGEDLYGVTARHVLFATTEGNDLYRYNTSAPKKNVVLMGNRAFDNLLESIQALIGTLRNTVTVLEKRVSAHADRARVGNQQAAADQDKFQQSLDETRATIADLRKFWAALKKDWSAVDNRVIGHVVWSPPISGLNPVCVVKLDKDKFIPNLRGNSVDLGTEIEAGRFMSLLYPRNNAPSKFDYPEDSLYLLQVPNSQDIKGDPTRFVIKRGHTTLITIGRLNGFESHKRHYGLLGNFNSIEAAVYPYDNNSGPFSRGTDSGAAIIGTNHDFVAQLTGGTGSTDSSDITYGTPMEWLWDKVIKVEFPRAVLFFNGPATH